MPQDLELEEGIVLYPLVEDKVEHEPATVCVWATGGREGRSNKASGLRSDAYLSSFHFITAKTRTRRASKRGVYIIHSPLGQSIVVLFTNPLPEVT
jgi:hypothetical protein